MIDIRIHITDGSFIQHPRDIPLDQYIRLGKRSIRGERRKKKFFKKKKKLLVDI